MILLLVHHGEAVGPEVDFERPLSERGRLETEQVAREALAHGVKPAQVWHSGKLRSRQTAEILWRTLNPLATFTAVAGLQPSDAPSRMAKRLAVEDDDLVIVGHYPHLPDLLAILLGASPASPSAFPAHGIVALERMDETWRECWRVTVAR